MVHATLLTEQIPLVAVRPNKSHSPNRDCSPPHPGRCHQDFHSQLACWAFCLTEAADACLRSVQPQMKAEWVVETKAIYAPKGTTAPDGGVAHFRYSRPPDDLLV